MSRRRTYEGRIGRVYGFVFGSVFLGVGIMLSTILAVRGDLVGEGLQQTIVDLAPWLNTTAGPELSLGAMAAGGAFGAFCVLYGLYHIGRVFLVDEYSITMGTRSGGPP